MTNTERINQMGLVDEHGNNVAIESVIGLRHKSIADLEAMRKRAYATQRVIRDRYNGGRIELEANNAVARIENEWQRRLTNI